MTPEEMQARILELTDENAQLKADKETLSKNNEDLTKSNEELRTLNQKYFNRLIAEEKPEGEDDNDEEEDKTPSCEELANSLVGKLF